MATRRLRQAPVPAPPATVRPLTAVLVTLAVVGVVLLAGLGLDAALRPNLTGQFKNCHPQRQLAPRLYSEAPAMCIDPKRQYGAKIVTTHGDVSVVFNPSTAPATVNNFIVLALNGYYNGLPFFGKKAWLIQTGDSQGDGRGGPGYTLPEEPDPLEHWQPGSLGMARLGGSGPLSGGQFFITTDNWAGGTPNLAYNHFATITLGFDIAQGLTSADRVVRIDLH